MSSEDGFTPEIRNSPDSSREESKKSNCITHNSITTMETQTLSTLISYAAPAITAAAGWLAGKRKRRNDFLKNMQDSIDILSMENKRLLEDLTNVNREVVALRRENGELKYSVDQLCKENVQLKDEVRNLKNRITNA